MMLLLAAIALPLALGNVGEMLLTRNINGVTHYLKIKSLGRKNLFGEAEWSIKRGTAFRWKWTTDQGTMLSSMSNKIQVLGKFKKKNLCLWWRGNYVQPFSVKKCDPEFAEKSLELGCVEEDDVAYFGKKVNTEGETKDIKKLTADIGIMQLIYDEVENDNDEIHVSPCDPVMYNQAPSSVYNFEAGDFDCEGCFTLFTSAGDQARWFGVQQGWRDLDKNGNAQGDVYAWKSTQKLDGDHAAVLKWVGDYIQVVGPSHVRTDTKPLCLMLDRSKTNMIFQSDMVDGYNGMPLKVQKCDKTIENGRFGCLYTHEATYFGMIWNAKKAVDGNQAIMKCPLGDINCVNAAQAKIDKNVNRMLGGFYSMAPGETNTHPENLHGPCDYKL